MQSLTVLMLIVDPVLLSKFIIVTVILNIDDVQKKLKVLLAFVTWLSDHEHRHWFPQPVEVWHVFCFSVDSSCIE